MVATSSVRRKRGAAADTPAPWLQTLRLDFREFVASDIDDLVRLDSDPRVLKYINGGKPMARADAEASMRRVLPYYALYPGLGVWRAERRDNKDFVGWYCLKYCPPTTDVEVGYRLLHKHWGHGYATEGARALVDFAFDDLGLKRVIGVTDPGNNASQHVLAEIGIARCRMGKLLQLAPAPVRRRRGRACARRAAMTRRLTVSAALAASGLIPFEAKILLGHVLDRDRAWLAAHRSTGIAAEQAEAFEEIARRRRDGEPVAYLTGRREFHDLDLLVTPDVLIPRPETELLVELALSRIALDDALRVLDLGTGSGAVALAIAKQRPRASVLGVDVSRAARALATRNAARLDIGNVSFVESDWFAALLDSDLISSSAIRRMSRRTTRT